MVNKVLEYFKMKPSGVIYTDKSYEQVCKDLNEVVCRDNYYIFPAEKTPWRHIFYQKNGQENDFHSLYTSWKAFGYGKTGGFMPIFDIDLHQEANGYVEVRYSAHYWAGMGLSLMIAAMFILCGLICYALAAIVGIFQLLLFGTAFVLLGVYYNKIQFWNPYNKAVKRLTEVVEGLGQNGKHS